MPRLTEETQNRRMDDILDAAELCFARRGFHASTMQDICRQASVSPGALYAHFASKDALIEGIVQRDRRDIIRDFRIAAESPDVLTALEGIGRHYLITRGDHKAKMVIEIGAEATRNPRIAALFRTVDCAIKDEMKLLLARAIGSLPGPSAMPIEAVTMLMVLLGDGMFWRRAVDPDFSPDEALCTVLSVLRLALGPAMPMPSSTADMPHSETLSSCPEVTA